MTRLRNFHILYIVLLIVIIPTHGLADHYASLPDFKTQTSNPVNKQFYKLIIDNDLKQLQAFLVDGADPNINDNKLISPVHYAAHSGNIEALRILIRHGADFTGGPSGGWSPLHCAALHGNRNIAEVLVAMGAKVDQKDDRGDTPLFYAVEGGNLPEVKLLVEHGANINEVNHIQETPMLRAISYRQKDISEYLSSQGSMQAE